MLSAHIFFNRHCNPCGFWPTQLSLSILRRKVFTECLCKRHVKPPNLEDQWLERSSSRHRESTSVWNDASETQQRNVELWARKLPRILPKVATSTSLLGSFTCRKFTTWVRRFYFPSEGRRAEDFFARKIRRLQPGLNPRTRVPEASTFTSRSPKSLSVQFSHLNFSLRAFLLPEIISIIISDINATMKNTGVTVRTH